MGQLPSGQTYKSKLGHGGHNGQLPRVVHCRERYGYRPGPSHSGHASAGDQKSPHQHEKEAAAKWRILVGWFVRIGPL